MADDAARFAFSAADGSAEQLEPDTPPLAEPLRALLADVDEQFTGLGGSAMAWADPHLLPGGEWRAPAEEEYSRVLDPEKYRILWLRAEAWARVLSARGWAERTEVEGTDAAHWLGEQLVAPQGVTVLQPEGAGAVPLRLARTAPESSIRGILLGAGEPAASLELFPACGCDACDGGSAELLSGLDGLILAVVEGAFELSWDGRELRLRTADRGTSGGGDGAPEPFRIVAAPWAEGWTPRPLVRFEFGPD